MLNTDEAGTAGRESELKTAGKVEGFLGRRGGEVCATLNGLEAKQKQINK